MPAPRAIPAQEVLKDTSVWKVEDLRALCVEHGLSILREDGGSKVRARLVADLVAKAAEGDDPEPELELGNVADRLLDVCASGFAEAVAAALPGAKRGDPTPAALWALEALAKETGRTLDASVVAHVKVLVTELIGRQALPLEVGRDAAEQAVGVILQLAVR